MGSDPQYAKYPDLSLAQDIFTLTNSASTKQSRQNALKKLNGAISTHKMAPLYRYLAHPTDGVLNVAGEGTVSRTASKGKRSNSTSKITGPGGAHTDSRMPWDEKLYEKLKKENEEELQAIRKEEEEAAEKAGDTEVQAAKGKRAEFWARVGDQVSEDRKLGNARGGANRIS